MQDTVVGVVGAGTMGGGIAHTAALANFSVVLCDVKEEYVTAAKVRMERLMDKRIQKGKMTEEEKQQVLERVRTTTSLEDMKECTFVIEAVVEDIDVKKNVFEQLDSILPEDAIITTNTSSMSITVIASSTSRPEKIAGMHFFNPPQIMKLVEVIRGVKTSDETVAQAMELARLFGKEPIEVKKDVPGFIVNRIMIPQFIEAIRLVFLL